MNKIRLRKFLTMDFKRYLVSIVAFAVLQSSAVAHLQVHSFADIVEDIEHSIVNISVGTNQYESYYKFRQDRFFGFREPSPDDGDIIPIGTGVIIDDEEGYIVTNNHVLSFAENVFVTLLDGRTFEADIVGYDDGIDLALLQIQAENLIEIPIGDSDELRVGDVVLAVGSPFGLSATVTTGIVSALNRRNLGLDQYEDYIQTDAAINPGSSGGALVNLLGELVGINTAIYSRTGGYIGISFAIPSNTAMGVVGHLAEFGRVHRGLLGVTFTEPTAGQVARQGGNSPRGVVIRSIVDGSAAMSAGLRQGDLLTHINDVEIAEGHQLRNTMALIRIGEVVNVRYVRDGVEYQGQGTVAPYVLDGVSIVGEELDPILAGANLKVLHESTPGVIVVDILQPSTAWDQLGLRKNDIIYEVNEQAVRDFYDLYSVISNSRTGVVMRVLREGQVHYLTTAI